jgi:hypothetical protein
MVVSALGSLPRVEGFDINRMLSVARDEALDGTSV